MELKDMTNDELEARKAEIVAELDADGADLDALEAEVRAIKAEQENRKAVEAQKAEVRAAVAEGKGEVIETIPEERKATMDILELRKDSRYVDAYADYIKGAKKEEEVRALITELGITNQGTQGAGLPVPTIISEIVETAWESDRIMSLVKKTYFKGIFKQAFEISASPAGWHNEGDTAVDEETLKHGIVTMEPKMIKKWIGVSDEILSTRNGEEFLRYVYDELTYQIVKFAAAQLLSIIAAAGTQSSPTTVGLPQVGVTTMGLGDIVEGLGALSGRASDITAVMNRQTWAAYKALELGANYAMDLFSGMRVVYDDSLKAFSAATTGDTFMIIGDFQLGARANFPNGDEVEIIVDPYSGKKQDLVEVLGKEYVALGVVAPDSFVRYVVE